MDTDEFQEQKTFLETKTRTELESDLERCLERKRNLEEEKNALHNLKIDLETVLKQREEELSTMRVQLESNKSAREEAERRLEELKEMRSGDQGAIDELNQRIHQAGQANQELQEELGRVKDLLEQAERDKETYKAYSNEAEKLVEVKTGKLMADLRELEQINQQCQREIEGRDEKMREYREEIERVKAEKDTLEEQVLTRKGMQVVSSEFIDELRARLDALQRVVNEFGPQGEGAEGGLEGVDVCVDEAEPLLVEPEQIGGEPAEPEGLKQGGEEVAVGPVFEVPEGRGDEGDIEPVPEVPEGRSDVEPISEITEFEPEGEPLLEEVEPEPLREEPTEPAGEEQLWEEPEGEGVPEEEAEGEKAEEEEKFPWEDEGEELGWGF